MGFFYIIFPWNGKREDRRKGWLRWSMVCKVQSMELCCSQWTTIVNSNSSEIVYPTIKLLYNVETAVYANYTCSLVWSPHMQFISSSLSNTYPTKLLLEACIYLLSIVCIVTPDLGCCSLHVCTLCQLLLPSYQSKLITWFWGFTCYE